MKNNISLKVILSILIFSPGLFNFMDAAENNKTRNWPSFRGYRAEGVARNQNLPLHWEGKSGKNIKWKTAIPGLGHSSPVIWGDKIFLTTAVNTKGTPYLKVGLYGASPDHPENVIHHFMVYCLSTRTGKIIWEKTAHSGIPKVKRHIKSSHANSSAATDGRYVLAFFGSEGLYCYSMGGKLLWKKDLGLLDAGAFDQPKIQWGFGSSPILYKDKVMVICDVNNQSFIACFKAENGRELWRTLRDENPTWGTPAVYEGKKTLQVIVNGYKRIASYDINSGKELWWLRGGGDVPVPTPVVSEDFVYISNSHGRLRPIYAINLQARGNISLAHGARSSQFIAWYYPRRGCYIPTPIVYGKYLYIADDRGILSCYDKKTGQEMYRTRIRGKIYPHSGSPVAADGRLYITDEYGFTDIVKAGPEFKLLATNKLGEICMATPAIAGQRLFLRSSRHIFAIGKK